MKNLALLVAVAVALGGIAFTSSADAKTAHHRRSVHAVVSPSGHVSRGFRHGLFRNIPCVSNFNVHPTNGAYICGQ